MFRYPSLIVAMVAVASASFAQTASAKNPTCAIVRLADTAPSADGKPGLPNIISVFEADYENCFYNLPRQMGSNGGVAFELYHSDLGQNQKVAVNVEASTDAPEGPSKCELKAKIKDSFNLSSIFESNYDHCCPAQFTGSVPAESRNSGGLHGVDAPGAATAAL